MLQTSSMISYQLGKLPVNYCFVQLGKNKVLLGNLHIQDSMTSVIAASSLPVLLNMTPTVGKWKL